MKIQEVGVVTHLRPGVAQVTILKNSAEECGGDGDCGGCASRQDRVVIWEVETLENELELGRKVVIEVDPPSAYYGIIFLLLLPMLTFFGTLMGGIAFAENHPDLYTWKAGFGVLCACLATVVAYVLAAVVDRRLRTSEKHKPSIVRVEEPCSEHGSDDRAYLLLLELARWHDPLQLEPVLEILKKNPGVVSADANQDGRGLRVVFDHEQIQASSIQAILKNQGLEVAL